MSEELLPCDLRIGATLFRKGTSISAAQACADRLWTEYCKMSRPTPPSAGDADRANKFADEHFFTPMGKHMLCPVLAAEFASIRREERERAAEIHDRQARGGLTIVCLETNEKKKDE